MKKFVILGLITTITTSILSTTALASNIKNVDSNNYIEYQKDTNYELQQENINEQHNTSEVSSETKKFVEDVEPYVISNEEGKLSLAGNIPVEIQERYNLENLKIYFSKLNEETEKGNLIIQKDLTITMTNNEFNDEIYPEAKTRLDLERIQEIKEMYFGGEFRLDIVKNVQMMLQGQLR